MLSKAGIKDIQRLHRRKERDESGLFIAEGPRMAEELIRTMPSYIKMIYATSSWITENENILPAGRVTEVDEASLQKISCLHTPNRVLIISRQFPAEPPEQKDFILYLDRIQDPGNFGTIIRTADWFGIRHMVCSPGCADPYNPKVVQATMASITRVNIWYDRQDEWIISPVLPLYAAVLGGTPLSQIPQTTSGILMLGNESQGLRDSLSAMAGYRISIPGRGGAESLNVAVAAGIILSHLLA